MAVKPAGMCWVMTTPGMFSGNCLSTSKMASVPPVEAPMAMTMSRQAASFVESEVLKAGIFTEGGEAGAAGGIRTRDAAAAVNFAMSMERNASLSTWLSISGFLTKSTAPAASASKTLTFREDTRMTGIGWLGRYSFKKSRPDIPGISISRVSTSGFKTGILFLASKALTAYPTISNRGSFSRFPISQLR